jgi:hypothetical protein
MSTSLWCRGANKLTACRSLAQTSSVAKVAWLHAVVAAAADAAVLLAAEVVVSLAGEVTAPVARGRVLFHLGLQQGKEK